MAKKNSNNGDKKITMDLNKEINNLKNALDALDIDVELLKDKWNGPNSNQTIKEIKKYLDDNNSIAEELDSILNDVIK